MWKRCEEFGLTSKVESFRWERLLGRGDFADCLGALAQSRLVSFRWEPGIDARLAGNVRVDLHFEVSEQVYDVFFNSRYGYRAQFAVAKELGQKADRSALEALWPICRETQVVRTDSLRVERSYFGPGSKIWVDERQVENEISCGEVQILYSRWANSGKRAGLVAPLGTRLNAKGAWLTEKDEFVLDYKKANRSAEIHNTGYT